MPSFTSERLSVGAFYNPHLAEALLSEGAADHLSMADPPAADDALFPRIREQFPLLLHDYLGQLADPLSDHALERARNLQQAYRGPWIAEHFQCLRTEDGKSEIPDECKFASPRPCCPDGPALAISDSCGRGLHPHRGFFWPTYTSQ